MALQSCALGMKHNATVIHVRVTYYEQNAKCHTTVLITCTYALFMNFPFS